MKRSNWKLSSLAAAVAVAATTFGSQAQAAYVSFTTTGGPGAVAVDIFANNLPTALGGFAFALNYSAALTFASFAVNPDAKMGALPLDLSLGNLGGSVDFFELADAVITQPALYALQGSGAGSFRLGRVNFTAAAAGPYALSLSGVSLSQFDGVTTICSGAACTSNIPEPMTPLLVVAALGALALSRRQQQRV